jgi:hypothetical protein
MSITPFPLTSWKTVTHKLPFWIGVFVGVGVNVGACAGVFVGVGVGGTCTPKYTTVVPPGGTFAEAEVAVVLMVKPCGLVVILTLWEPGRTTWQNGSSVLANPVLTTLTSAPVSTGSVP